MIAPPPMILVGGGSLLLISMAVALVLTERAKQAKQVRIASLLKAYTPATRDQRAARTGISTPVQAQESANSLLRLFGIRTHRDDLYPAPWWVLLLTVGVAATIASALLSAVVGVYAWVAQPLFWVMMSRSTFGMFAARRARVLYTQMPDALAMIVRSVRTGIPVQEALRIVGREAQPPTSLEFEKLYNQLLIGQTLPEALILLAKRTEVPEYRFFAVALALQGQTGGSLTDTLENLADVIRKRTAMRARAYALSSEARTTMMVLAALPIVAFLALSVISPDYIALLLNNARGRQILALAVIMLTVGIGTMQYMIKKALS